MVKEIMSIEPGGESLKETFAKASDDILRLCLQVMGTEENRTLQKVESIRPALDEFLLHRNVLIRTETPSALTEITLDRLLILMTTPPNHGGGVTVSEHDSEMTDVLRLFAVHLLLDFYFFLQNPEVLENLQGMTGSAVSSDRRQSAIAKLLVQNINDFLTGENKERNLESYLNLPIPEMLFFMIAKLAKEVRGFLPIDRNGIEIDQVANIGKLIATLENFVNIIVLDKDIDSL